MVEFKDVSRSNREHKLEKKDEEDFRKHIKFYHRNTYIKASAMLHVRIGE